MSKQIINLGSNPGTKNGDGARTGGRKINENFTEVYDTIDLLIADSTLYNKIIESTGFSLSGQNLTINADWRWLLGNIEKTNPANVVVNIPFSATGKSRIEYIVPNDTNGFTRISGIESTTVPVAPPIPNKDMFVTWYIVDDGTIGTTALPITGDAYLTKREKQPFQVWNSGEINNTYLDDFYYGYLNFRGSVTNIKSILGYGANIYSGQEILIKNSQTTNITIYHLIGTGFQFSFPNATNFVLKPNEIIRFSMKITDPTSGVLEYVGIIASTTFTGTSNDITEGSSNLYFTAARVLATLLTGISFATGGAIVSTDSVLVAFGKIQKQITDLLATGSRLITSGEITKLSNTSNTNSGDETTATIKTKLGITTLSGSNTGDQDLTPYALAAITVVKIGTNTTLDNSYNGKVILLTASCTLTLPNGLMTGFNYSVKTRAGVTLTYALGSSVTILDNLGTTMAEKLSHTMAGTGTANEYLSVGSL